MPIKRNVFALVVLGCCVSLLGDASVLFAGGIFKERVQKKLNVPSKVQYEPYYLESNYQGQQMDQIAPAPAVPMATESEQGRVGGGYQYQNFESREYKEANQELREKSVVGGRLQHAKPDARSSLPASYAIYQADYRAELEQNVATVSGKVVFEVFRKGWTQLPLVRSNVGLLDVSVNRGAAFVTMQGGQYYLMMDKPGRYTLNFEFLTKVAREREHGPGSFNFDVMPAPISQFELTIPEPGVDIFVEPAIRVEVGEKENKTVAWAIMPNTPTIVARWTKALAKEEIVPVKLEPKVYADTSTYASIGEGIVRCHTQLSYSILQSEVSSFRLLIPSDVSVLDVSGADLRDWKVSKIEGGQHVDVYLNFGIKGAYVLNVEYERNIGEGSTAAEIPTIKAVGVERETGYLGVAARTNVELDVNKLDRVNAIDVKELPATIWRSSANPILLAFKYLNHPFSVILDVTKHEELPVLVAAVDRADHVSVHTQDGKVLTKSTYQVRNNVKQFLRLVLPTTATLHSSFVSGKPVKPAKDKNGNVLIPLEKSQMQGENLAGFPVEIVYLVEKPALGRWGDIALALPQTDIPVSEAHWSVYLPEDYRYFNFRGDLKLLERDVSGQWLGAQLGGRILRGRLLSSADDIGEQFSPGNTNYVMTQTTGAQVTGVLPIRINVPQEGQLLQFSKLLVTEKESPSIKVGYVRVSRYLWPLWRGAIAILFFVLVLRFVRRLKRKNKGALLETPRGD